jgi:hypothetical protein
MRKLWLASVLLLAPVALGAQQLPEQPRTLTVSAQGNVERVPDRAVLGLAVESESSNARDAARTNATKMERVVAALRAAGVPADRIRTIGYELHPTYARPDRAEDPPRIAGYRAVNRLQVTLDALDRVGPALDAAIEAGANRASNLHFTLRDASSARIEALQQATAKARAEAQAIAAAAGETLGVVQSIHTDSYMPPPAPAMEYARAAAMDMKAETPVESGTLNVTANVTIVFRLGS